jgi:hypothetical protein
VNGWPHAKHEHPNERDKQQTDEIQRIQSESSSTTSKGISAVHNQSNLKKQFCFLYRYSSDVPGSCVENWEFLWMFAMKMETIN